ncbi:MAG: hypothetical protein AB1554_01365 [Chloroflexota bacterium]
MKVTWKGIALLLVSVLALLSIVDLLNANKVLATLNIPTTRYLIDNNKSKLLSLLILPDDLQSEFSWYYVLVTQGNIPPTEEIDIVDGASATLGGFYQGKEIGIITQIAEYNSNDVNEILNVSYFNSRFVHSPIKELSDLHLVRVSNIQKHKCSYSITNETQCSVGLIVSDMVITVDVQIRAILDRSAIEQVLNLLLVTLKKNLEQTSYLRQLFA